MFLGEKKKWFST